ncbi:MAG TPA: aspartyl/asparaginyl beta-hydroxylase domain-containing protein [Steroidobacteraceae bacterium]
MNAKPDELQRAAEELHERARGLLAANNPAAARALLEKVVTMAPRHVPFWLSLAAVLRALGKREEELSALERALTLDPTHVVVLLQKAAALDLMSKPRAAAVVYTHALQALPPGTRLPPPIEAHVQHARKRVTENSAQLSTLIESRLAALPGASHGTGERARFDRCLDRVLGRRRVYAPDPTFMLFPFLMNFEFLPQDYFPFLADVEACTDAIREELIGVLAEDDRDIRPYVAYGEGVPLNQWRELNHSRRWGAYFLWDEGRPLEDHIARCPKTAAMLTTIPGVDIPGRGPTSFFSILEGHTTIPPHTGVTNTRVIVHLPLIVPPGCRFRVGGETREWRPGETWVFDDTIEHEAWNDSDLARAILIFDVWNPQLTPIERELIREATMAIVQYRDAENAP